MARTTSDAANYLPPKDEDKLLPWLERKKDEAAAISEYEAKENLAFFLGQQFGVWNKDRRRFDRPTTDRSPNAPVRVPVNKIAGLGERVIARLTKSAPIPECRPVTDTQSDVNTARVGTRMLDHEMNRLAFQQRLPELYFWVLPLGTSYFHLRWDPAAGAVAGIDEDGAEVRQGDIVLEEVPAFELRLDPNARRFRDAQWAIRTVAMTKEAVFEQYGKSAEGCEAADNLRDEWTFSAGDGLPKKGGGTGAKDKTNFVAVHQYWLRPGGRAKPEGCVITWSGSTVLEEPMPFPYEHGHLPFVPFNLLPALSAGPFGRTWVTDLVPMQRDYNDARSREAAIRRTLVPKLLAARGQIDPNRVTSRVEIIDFNPTGPEPKWLNPNASWMAQHETAMNRSDAEMGERAGQGDASSGTGATTATAATTLALQEADETKLAISAKELAAGVQELGWQILMLIRQFWTEERIVRTWSRDGELEVSQFSGADLADQLDVHVATESALPRSKAARTQLAIDLFTQGLLGQGPEAQRNFLRMLDMPGTDFILETLNLDAKQAEREHGRLLKLEPVEAKAWHNHMAHMATHQEFMKSEEYEHLSPEQQAWFDGHYVTHAGLALGQLGVPTPPGTPSAEGGVPGAAGNPLGANGEYLDPMTGKPQDPLAVAAGMAPSSLEGSKVQAKQSPVGGAGNPGPVPGQSNDQVAHRTGN